MLLGAIGGCDGGAELHALDERVVTAGEGLGKNIEFGIGAGGEKSKRADIDTCHGDVGGPDFIGGVQHGAVTSEHGDHIAARGKCTGIDAVRGVNQFGRVSFENP